MLRGQVSLLALAVLLAGCASPTPEPPPTPTPTPEPTPTPTPTPEPSPPGPDVPGLAFHERARLPIPGRVGAAEFATYAGGGAAIADSDRDRRLDLWLSGPEGVKLYRNTTEGPRTDVTEQVGLACACKALGVLPGDMDNDGLPDLFVLVEGGPSRIYRNGNSSFTQLSAAQAPGLPSDGTSAAWLDLDNDGLLDLLVSRDGGDPVALRNKNGSFEAASSALWPSGAGAAHGMALADLNADGFLDVLLTGANGFKALRNGNGSFAPFSGFNGTTAARTAVAGDFDNSGTQDVLLAGDSGLILLSNQRARSLRALPALLSEPVWSVAFVDNDLDGFLDIVAVPQAGGLRLLRNTGSGGFFQPVEAAEAGLPASGEFRGLALGDFDNDGRTDLLATRIDAPAMLFHNGNGQGPGPGRFFKVVPSGVQSNRDGVGARIVGSGENLLLERYVVTGGSILSTSAPEVVLGLGAANLTNLRIQWPSGTLQDQSIPRDNNFDRTLFASEEASRSEWGDNAC